jgi:hypothetical protein
MNRLVSHIRRGAAGRLGIGALVAVFLIGASSSVYAQSLHIGVKGGYSPANLHGKDVGNWLAEEPGRASDWRHGFTAGALISYKFHRQFAVQSEVNYTQKGARMTLTGDDGENIKGAANFDYVEIPLLFKFTPAIGTGDAANPYLFAGPMFGIRATCDFDAEVTFQGTSLSQNGGCGKSVAFGDDVIDYPDIDKVDYGIAVGGGVGIPIGSTQLWFDGRYVFGLNRIADTGDNVKNHSYAATVALTVPIWSGTSVVAAR